MIATELFPFQVEGAMWLAARRHALLADEMGLGKSAQAIAAADDILAQRILVICPAVARINWSREFNKFSLYTRRFHVALSSKERPPASMSLICSYDLAVRFFDDGRWLGHFDLVILDEAHFLKNFEAKRTRAVLGDGGIARRAKTIWALTGTPMPNHPGELWVLLYTFGATTLSYSAFTTRFCEFAIGGNPKKPALRVAGLKHEALPELRKLLAGVCLRRRTAQVMDLPPLLISDFVVEPGPIESSGEVMAIIEAQAAKLEAEIGPMLGLSPDALFAMLEALAGSVASLRRYCGLRKVAATADLVAQEIDAGCYKKIIIFAIHRDVVAALAARLSKYGVVVVNGGVGAVRAQAAVDAFQNDPNCRIFIGNIQAAGTAITLTASSQVLFIEQSWTPGDNAQALKRAHRISQRNTVVVRCLGLAGSIDERVNAVLRRKLRDITAVLD